MPKAKIPANWRLNPPKINKAAKKTIPALINAEIKFPNGRNIEARISPTVKIITSIIAKPISTFNKEVAWKALRKKRKIIKKILPRIFPMSKKGIERKGMEIKSSE